MNSSRYHEDLIEGYRDGLGDEHESFPVLSNRSNAYRHGWLNGRDDRLGRPRASAAELRAEAKSIAEEEAILNPRIG